uniref:Uncharacterized protein n=1 Tax=Onchocerca volvulus TaxID=6282 RepID=A0A8R1TTF9_ONCVO
MHYQKSDINLLILMKCWDKDFYEKGFLEKSGQIFFNSRLASCPHHKCNYFSN